MKHKLLSKSLLMAVGLFVGASTAWAGWSPVYSNNYETAATFDENWVFAANGSGTKYKACQITDGSNHYLKIRENTRNGGNGVFTLPDYSSYEQYEMSFKIGFYTSNNKGSEFQIRNGNTSLAKFTWGTWSAEGATIKYFIGSNATQESETLAATIQSGTTRASDTSNSIVKWYTFTIAGNNNNGKVTLTVNDGSSDIISNSQISDSYLTITGLYVTLGSAHAEIGLDDMLVQVYSDQELVSTPSIDVAYAGANRTVTITPGVSSGSNSVTTYYTTDGSDPTSSSSVYSSALTITEDCTIKAITISSNSTASEIAESIVTVGKLELKAPTISKTGYSEGNYTITITSDQSTLSYVPASATIKYSIDGGAEETYSSALNVPAGSSVSAYVEAENYTTSPIADCATAARPVYPVNWTQDYTKVTSSAGTGNQPVGLSASADFTVNETNFYNIVSYGNGDPATAVNLNTNVGLSTSNGFGLRCNGANSGILKNSGSGFIGIQNLNEGDYIVMTVMNVTPVANYGVTFQEAMSTTSEVVFLATAPEASLSIPSGTYNYIKSITVLSSTVPVSVSAAGYATLYSEYALTIPTGVKAYTGKVSGNKLVLSEVETTIPANTAVVLEAGEGTYSFAVTTADAFSGENDLKGVLAETFIDPGSVLVLGYEDSEVGFYRFYGLTLAAGKAYLEMPASGAPAIYFSFEEETEVTGVYNLRVEEKANAAFDLTGRRANGKGLMIQNGKVVLVK